jgi:uncharacterized phage protein (TIGR01671 family)
MREIKFRIWAVESKTMMKDIHPFNKNESFFVVGEGIPMQFTGLKDMHETDIYEGDIVEVEVCLKHTRIERCGGKDNVEEDKYSTTILGDVRWYYDRFSVFHTSNHELSTWIKSNSIVVGNIYENPELLK